MTFRIILAFIFLIFSCFAFYSQYQRYQKLGSDITNETDQEVLTALKKAQNKIIPSMVISALGILSLIALFLFIMSAP